MMWKVPSEEHFVEDNADGPDIGFAVVLCPSQNFGGHIKRRAQHSFSKLLVGEQFAESKISYLDFSVMHEDIG